MVSTTQLNTRTETDASVSAAEQQRPEETDVPKTLEEDVEAELDRLGQGGRWIW